MTKDLGPGLPGLLGEDAQAAQREPPRSLRVTVYGSARPAGSKRAFAIKKGGEYTGKVAMKDDAKGSGSWKRQVSQIVGEQVKATGFQLLRGPVELDLTFYVMRPNGHFGSGRNAGTIRASAPPYPTVRPDLLKLARAVEDALTKVVYSDDAVIVTEHLEKRYGTPERVEIELREAAPHGAPSYSSELEF